MQTTKHRAPFGTRWVIPASAAAVMLLSLGVLLQVQGPDLLAPNETDPAPAAATMAEAPPSMMSNAPEQTPDRRLAKAERPASKSTPMPASVPDVADSLLADKMQPSTVGNLSKAQLPATERYTAPPATSEMAQGMLANKVEAKTKQPAKAPEPATTLASTSVARERRAEQTKTGALEEGKSSSRNALQEADTLNIHADVTTVRASGQAGAYDFNVTLQSPDSGCQQYADWWEVVSEDGKLLYRRVLLHSHAQEQPFTRSGGPVPIQPSTRVWVRAHMNNSGYGGVALLGSVQAGFAPAVPKAGFAAGLATQAPLPAGCDF